MVGRIFLGRYEAISLIGEGGMGRVYLAKQLDLDRQVVVKVMHDNLAADPLFCERFQRETKIMARFSHPYAVTLYDASLDDPQGPCIIMEYIQGITLDVLLQRNGRLPAKRVGRLLSQLCEVLQAAHGKEIIHRDLKPANLMVVDPDTPYELIKVMDFGLAKPIQAASDRMKVTGSSSDFAVGTPGYMCPEQARGEDMDHRGDLYAVGVILYELLSGRLPFTGTSTMDVLLAHATESPPPFAAVGAGHHVPPAIEEVVQACLAKDKNDRPGCARDVAERFEAALSQAEQENTPLPAQIRTLQAQARQLANTSPTIPQRQPQEPPHTNGHTSQHEMVQTVEAWMPEMIASYKLRGFVEDAGGEVLESVPGRIKVRLGGRGSAYELPQRGGSWFSFGRKNTLIEMELQLERPNPHQSMILISVTLRPRGGTPIDEDWRARCGQIYCDLRAYLMGSHATAPVG